jgi:hypothetical protein
LPGNPMAQIHLAATKQILIVFLVDTSGSCTIIPRNECCLFLSLVRN